MVDKDNGRAKVPQTKTEHFPNADSRLEHFVSPKYFD